MEIISRGREIDMEATARRQAARASRDHLIGSNISFARRMADIAVGHPE